MTPYWRRNLTLIAALLTVLFAATFVVVFFARGLNFHVFGGPLSYWLGAQGMILLYVIIIAVYAFLMNRRDSRERNASRMRNARGE